MSNTHNYLEKLIVNYSSLSSIADDIQKAFLLIKDNVLLGKKIITCGNGGSAADADHIVGELMKGFHLKRELTSKQVENIFKYYPQETDIIKNLQQAIPSISLTGNAAFATAFANDVNADFVFAQQIFGLGNRKDILIAISTSGNSINVIHAAKIARTKGMIVISLTGQSGGELAKHSDVTIAAPASAVAAIQELHLPIYHCLCSMLEEEFFGKNCCDSGLEVTSKAMLNDDFLSAVELVVFDFDGVFTDNKVFTSQEGVESVLCDRSDSLGISMLKDTGINMMILSTETNPVVIARAKKMGLEVKGGCENKKDFLEQYLQKNNIDYNRVIYMGNDLNDKEVMKITGASVVPSDANPKLIVEASLVLQKKGGNGAVRELCDVLLKNRRS